MKYLHEVNSGAKCYSFGKVSRVIKRGLLEVAFHDSRQKLLTNLKLDVGEWIRFYGEVRSSIFVPVFVTKLTECDIKVMEKGIEYVRMNKI